MRAPFQLRLSIRPLHNRVAQRCHVAHQPEHQLCFTERGNDVRFRAAVNRSDVHRGLAEHGVGGQREQLRRGQECEHRLDGGDAEFCVGGMRGAAARADDDALRALRAGGELALRRFAIHEVRACGGQQVGGPRTIGPLLFANDEQQIDALFTRRDQTFGRAEHGRGDSLRVAGTATIEPLTFFSRRDIRRHGIEMRGERHSMAGARRPDVRPPLGHLLSGDIPTAGDEPASDKVDGGSFRPAGRLEREQFGGESDDVSHDAQISRAAPLRGRRTESRGPRRVPGDEFPSSRWATPARSPRRDPRAR